jgi:PPOX class probable F420-dependent enzyme
MELSETVRAFLEQPRHCVMGTINRDGSPQLTAMWYELVGDTVILNTTRGLVKERNLRRDPRMSICVVDGQRFVTLSGRAEIIEDRAVQEAEVRSLATRYIGPRLGGRRWDVIKVHDRLSVHLHVERVITHNLA